MKSLWNDSEAQKCGNDPLKLRVYTSRLLGSEPSLVLHGGGNTSVKASAVNLFGQKQEVLYVKGSGWDLSTIEAAGFAPVQLTTLQRMAALEQLSDTDMVNAQRAAMMNPTAPNPSVEAILHAIIPFRYVDHTHADSVIALTNTPHGEELIRQVYGHRLLIIPYVMPGFVLARKVYEMSQGLDWSQVQGMILMNHGVFTFADDAQTSYERMIQLVTEAQQYLEENKALESLAAARPQSPLSLEKLAQLRKAVSTAQQQPLIVRLTNSEPACGFASLPDIESISTRGTLTPDHVIRTKRIPLIVDEEQIEECVDNYKQEYYEYFERNNDNTLTCLAPAPRWAVWPGQGTLAFGRSIKEAKIIEDITRHTVKAIQWAEKIETWKALDEKDIFEVEYWELEQAKLRKAGDSLPFQGKAALVTGAASGIGKACAETFLAQGACVMALDINSEIENMFNTQQASGRICDLTQPDAIAASIESLIREFGGLDIVVSNAGIFPPSTFIESINHDMWQKSIDINLTSHQQLLQHTIPYLKQGIDPAVVFIASKNVPAPGPGASAYSVAKAAVTQLARVAALELASYGIRVNVIHPNAVFDTAIWTEETLQARAHHYSMTVEEYKTNNLLKTEVRSKDVAALACAMAGPLFAKTTGAQVPVDGGNERVI